MTGARRVLPLILALVALTLAACGSDEDAGGEVPSDTAANLIGPVENAEQALQDGDCQAVADAASEYLLRIQNIGKDDVEQDVKTELFNAGKNMQDLAETDCTDTGTTDDTTGASGDAGAEVGSNEGPAAPGRKAKDKPDPATDPAAEDPVVAAKPEPPGQAKKQEAGANPVKPVKEKKPKKPKKPHGGKGPNGPPGPKGNPNHDDDFDTPSGGVAPRAEH